MKNINKILETLSLSASDTREDTLKSILITTLLRCPNEISYAQLIQNVESEFSLQLYEIEFKQILSKLIDENKVHFQNDKYELDAEFKGALKTLEYKLKSDDAVRYNSFTDFVGKKYPNFSKEELRNLWQLFREYIYECFYFYGVKANQMINPKYQIDIENVFTNSDILFSLYDKLPSTELREVLKYSVDNFSNYATKEDIDFLDELGQKTLAFTSLGLDPELAKDSFENNLVDWILFLDTNFLFSILDLHSNIEDDACKELLKLIQQNSEYIKIELKFTELTAKELRKKKEDFEVLDKNLSRSAISALLKSDDLDDFSRKFYTRLYNDPQNALHPSEIIDLSNLTLPKLHIELYRTKVMSDSLGESYLNSRIQEYQRYINEQNDFREQNKKKYGGKGYREIYRSDRQLEHDITLREVILFRRSSIKKKEFKTMNDVKYFASTLDEILLKYDNYELRKSEVNEYPVFFRPSYLLNKLVKVLPVKTQDYKKAFIKAVSARGFNKDIRKSYDILRIVSYLKTQGIDNEEVILNLINEQVFLERFKTESNSESFNMEHFIESEVNRLYEKKATELQNAQEELNVVKSQKSENETENNKLLKKVLTLTESLNLYQTEFSKVQTRLNKLEKTDRNESKHRVNQTYLDFEDSRNTTIRTLESKVATLEDEKKEILEQLNQSSKSKSLKRKKSIWRRNAWFQSLAIFLLSLTPFLFLLRRHNMDIRNTLEACKNNGLLTILIALVVVALNWIFIRQLYDKYYNHSNIKAYEDRMNNLYDQKN
jgi:hypothetical protein